MSFLPPLNDYEIAKQVAYLVNNGWIPCVEFAAPTEGFAIGGNAASVLGPGYYDNRYWTMYKLPMYGCTNPEQELQDYLSRLAGFEDEAEFQDQLGLGLDYG